jgi:hypothetical protein
LFYERHDLGAIESLTALARLKLKRIEDIYVKP